MSEPSVAKGKVSVVVPCYNYGLMLPETLASIERARSDVIAEIIVVDDGSDDETTRRIIQNLDAGRYKIIRQANQGLARARNAGIEVARGEFILPIDSDDLIRRAYFDQGVTVLLEDPEVGVVYGDPEYFGEKSGRWKLPEFDLRTLVKGNYITACSLFRRSVWDSVGGYDEKMRLGWEDWDFWMRAAFRGWKFIHLDEIAFDYRARRGSMSTEAMSRRADLVAYIFAKPENRLLKALRSQCEEAEALAHKIEALVQSKDYRVGRSIVNPLRKIKHLLFQPTEQLRQPPQRDKE